MQVTYIVLFLKRLCVCVCVCVLGLLASVKRCCNWGQNPVSSADPPHVCPIWRREVEGLVNGHATSHHSTRMQRRLDTVM